MAAVSETGPELASLAQIASMMQRELPSAPWALDISQPEKSFCLVLDNAELSCASKRQAAPLGDLSEVTNELIFFDDEKAISIRLNQSKVVKSLHKHTDSRLGRAYHLR